VNTEVITAVVVVILAVILGLRKIVRALGLLTQESSTFLEHIVVFSKEGRVLRRELRKWRGRRRQARRRRSDVDSSQRSSQRSRGE
jgi:hypothetical protein